LGDLVELAGQQAEIIDVDPDTGDVVVLQPRLISVPLAETGRYRLVARASLLRRCAMRVRAFALKVRDCGLRYALAAATAFALMVTQGTSPSYKRGEFSSYGDCVTAAHAEVETLGPNVRWDCVPER
jgi:hypothetical protein